MPVVKVTLGSELNKDLEAWADAEGTPKTTIAGQLVAAGIRDAKAKGLIPERDALKMLIIRMGVGEEIRDVELTVVAGKYDLPIETLKRLRDCLRENGERHGITERA